MTDPLVELAKERAELLALGIEQGTVSEYFVKRADKTHRYHRLTWYEEGKIKTRHLSGAVVAQTQAAVARRQRVEAIEQEIIGLIRIRRSV